MSTPKATQITDAVIAALGEVRTVNGYQTNAGLRVYRGRDVDLGDSGTDDLPALVVATRADPVGASSARKVMRAREIEVLGVARADAMDYEPGLDALDEDLCRALLPLTAPDALSNLATDVSLAGGSYDEPEAGSALRVVRFTLTVSYALTLQT